MMNALNKEMDLSGVLSKSAYIACFSGKHVEVRLEGVDWETVFPEIEFHKYIEWKKPDDYEIEQFIDIVGIEKIKSILEGK